MKKLTTIIGILSLALALPPIALASGVLSLSQTNVSLNVGQSATITATTYNGQIPNVTSVSNATMAYATVSNNLITVYGLNSGNSQITLCTYDNTCNTIYVTVGGSSNNGQISFSQNNLNLSAGQSMNVTVYNTFNNTLNISTNSNPNAISASLSGGIIYLTAQNSGNSTLTVCATNSQCNYLYVTVSGNNYSGSLTFSQANVNLNVYQTGSVTIYNSNSYYSNNFYVSSNTNSSIVSPTISSSTLNLYGQASGASTITVCSSGNNNCGTIYVNVNNNYNNTGSGTLTFGSTSLPQLVINQYYSYQLIVTGGTSPYTFSVTTGSLPVGLYLNTSGMLYGTPTNTYSTNFTIQARDAYGRIGTQNFIFNSNQTGSVLGALVYNNGTLINDNGTVYITYKNTKTGFGNLSAFQGLGYNLGNVIIASTSGLNSSNYIIGTASAAHPWGSWIKSGSTIYFVDPNGLIPIPTYDIFTTNGGVDVLVVNANAYDLARPMLSIMGYSDQRLQ